MTKAVQFVSVFQISKYLASVIYNIDVYKRQVLSISMAVTTFTGQNVGANRLDRVKKGMYSSLIMVLVYTVFIGCLLYTSQTIPQNAV